MSLSASLTVVAAFGSKELGTQELEHFLHTVKKENGHPVYHPQWDVADLVTLGQWLLEFWLGFWEPYQSS